MTRTKAGEGSESVIRALNSGLRRELMKIGWEGPMDRKGFHDAVLSRGFDVDSPDSVYVHLNKLARAGLMEKYYNTKQKCIFYRSRVDKVVIDLNNIKVDFEVYEKKADLEKPSLEVPSVFRALGTDLRRMLIKVLSEKPVGSGEAFDSLVRMGYDGNHRDVVYKDLEMLVDSGIAEKFYDGNRKMSAARYTRGRPRSTMITYRMKKGKLVLSVSDMKTGLLDNPPTEDYKVPGGL